MSLRGLLSLLGLSLLAALTATFLFVLPAEFNRDPTGLGALMGIKGMSAFDGAGGSVLTERPRAPYRDSVAFELAPFESVEYKYELDAGQTLVFGWQTQSPIEFDLHAEEHDKPPEESVTFSAGQSDAQAGTYVAPFAGRHGWFFENRGSEVVVVGLQTSSFATASVSYSPAGEYRRLLNDGLN